MTQITDNTPETLAVMDVIIRETDTFLAQDFDGWAACWVQDTRTREICMSSSFGATVLEGWEQLRDYMGKVIAAGAVCDIAHVVRSNVVATISGDLAHVVFDGRSEKASGQIEHTHETRVLERDAGVWRILYASFVLSGHQHVDENRLAVDATGGVLCAPAQARAHLAAHPGLQISHNRLRATKPAWDKLLQAGLQSAADRLPLVFGETDAGNVVVCVLFVRDGITFVETQHDGDLDARLKLAKTVFGLSESQMALTHRIVCGDNLTTAATTLSTPKPA